MSPFDILGIAFIAALVTGSWLVVIYLIVWGIFAILYAWDNYKRRRWQ